MAQSQQRGKGRGSSGQQSNRRRRSGGEQRRVAGLATLPPPEGPLLGIDEERARNDRFGVVASVVIAIVLGLLASIVALPFNLAAGIGVGVVAAIVAGIFVPRAASFGAVRLVSGAPVELASVPRVATLLEGLCSTFGVSEPELTVVPDPVRNAAIVSRRGTTTLVLTSGLVTDLSLVEMEGVLAHLLARQRIGAVSRSTLGAGIALLLGPIGRRPGIAHRLTGVGALYRADEIGAVTVRYPTGLAAALAAMVAGPLPGEGSLFSSSVYESARWLFVDPSIGRRAAEEELGDVDATAVRRRALEEW
jgi:hypothetical protein